MIDVNDFVQTKRLVELDSMMKRSADYCFVSFLLFVAQALGKNVFSNSMNYEKVYSK